MLKRKIVTDIEKAILNYVPEKPIKQFVYSGQWVSLWKNDKYRFWGHPKKDMCIFWNWSNTATGMIFFTKSASRRRIEISSVPKKVNKISEFNKLSDKKIITPYMKKKQITLKNYKIKKDILFIPIYDPDNQIISYQAISPKGKKRFKKDAPLGKAFHYPIGTDNDNHIFIAEGVATGATIHAITNNKVYCALTKTNMDNLAEMLLKKYEDKEIIMCLDNDQNKTHNTNVKNKKRFRTLIPEQPGDFNDHQHCYIEKYKLKTLIEPPTTDTKEFIINKLNYITNALHSNQDPNMIQESEFLDDEKIIPKNNAVLISGATESGKTGFCLCNAKKYLEQNKTVYIWEHSEMNRHNRLNKWKLGFKHQPIITRNKNEILNAFRKDNVILIDDCDSFFEMRKTTDRRVVGDTLEQISWICQLSQCTVLLAHFMTKASRQESDPKLRSGGSMTWINKVRFALIIETAKTEEVEISGDQGKEDKIKEKEKPYLVIQKGHRPKTKESAWWLNKDFSVGEPITKEELARIMQEKKEGADLFLKQIDKLITGGMGDDNRLSTKEYYQMCQDNFNLKKGMAYYYLTKLKKYKIDQEGFATTQKYFITRNYD